jgi:hypothetical protein
MPRKRPRWRLPAGGVVLAAVVLLLVWPLVPPPLPERVRIGTGVANGRYEAFGRALQARLEEKGFEVELVASEGSRENFERLAAGVLDVGLVQGGVVKRGDARGVHGVASLFYEPVWVFFRMGEDVELIRDYRGKRIAIGTEGSGSAALARTILVANGIEEGFVALGGDAALDALARREVDAVILVQAPTEQWVRDLVDDDRFDLLLFKRADAYAARYQHLEVLHVPRGFMDLAIDLPDEDVKLLTTTANLAVAKDAHPSLTTLLIELCRDELAQGSALTSPGTFPSLAQVDLPVSEDAVHYYRRGPSWLYRHLPFRVAHTADRLSILLIPLLTLLYPFLKGAGPFYRWVVGRRIYPWYRALQDLEEAAQQAPSPAEREEILRQLDEIARAVARIHVPARYTAELYGLRRHIALVIGQVQGGEVPPE